MCAMRTRRAGQAPQAPPDEAESRTTQRRPRRTKPLNNTQEIANTPKEMHK